MRSVFLLIIFFSAIPSVIQATPALVTSQINCSFFSGKKRCDLTVELKGEIVAASADEVAVLLSSTDTYLFRQFKIDSPGGNLDAAIAIGRMLRADRIAVIIGKGAQCVSACVMVLAGGVERRLLGIIGIHRPYLDQPIASQLPAPDKLRSNYEQMLNVVRAYLRDMNVSERLAEDMLKIPPADVRYLSNDELVNYGVTYLDPVEPASVTRFG
jgi:hypothetical protein